MQVIFQNTTEMPYPLPRSRNIQCGSSRKTELRSNQVLHQVLADTTFLPPTAKQIARTSKEIQQRQNSKPQNEP